MMNDAEALLKFLAREFPGAGLYVVGGAVRNFLLGLPIKDIDLVVDTFEAGMDSEAVARALQGVIPVPTSLETNQYGVALLNVNRREGPESPQWVLDGHDMHGWDIEIANARKEIYGDQDGKGYKPHTVSLATIEEDVLRREFTFNTLLWRVSDLAEGMAGAEVIDLTGQGINDLERRVMETPLDPDKTFMDDPTRTLRAVKFAIKCGATPSDRVADSIRRNAHRLADMPWEAVDSILHHNILSHEKVGEALVHMDTLGLTKVCAKLLQDNSDFRSAFGRRARAFPVWLMLRLQDRGFPMQPLGFLGDNVSRFREIVLGSPSGAVSDEVAAQLLADLRKPPINNMALIEKFSIRPAERRHLARVAREILLEWEWLAEPEDLHREMELRLAAHFGAN